VGIFPFAYEGSDATWEPLGVALAELLVTDLAITGRLNVLERAHVQTLLDELAIAEAGYVEQATAARSGRLLGSGHIVQGRFSIDAAQRIDVDAALVEVGPPGSERVEAIAREDAVERLFDLEKELALDLHAEMGIQLTPAEVALVSERQTESVQALLAFGRGLAAQDAGDFARAAEQFGEATMLDPAFSMAANRRASVSAAAMASGNAGTRQISGNATRLSRQRAAVAALRAAPASVRQRMLQRLASRQRAVLAEVLGQDRIGTTILLEVLFRRPGGEE
jgi:TolB-like protein